MMVLRQDSPMALKDLESAFSKSPHVFTKKKYKFPSAGVKYPAQCLI